MHDNRIILTKAQIANLDVDSTETSMKIAWNYIRGKVIASRYSAIVFQEQSVLDKRGIGGFFTSRKFVNVLYLSDKYYDRESRVLKFESDRDRAVFLHECSHFIHICSNFGKYTQKDLEIIKTLKAPKLPLDNTQRYFTEREAWQISLNINRCFRIGLEAEINTVNAHNMLNVERSMGFRKMTKEEVTAIEKTMTISDFRYEKSTTSK